MVFGLPGEGPVVLPESVKSWAGARVVVVTTTVLIVCAGFTLPVS
jgi:hypothetical protein